MMIVTTLLIGLVATALADLWQYGFLRYFDGSRPHWGKVGRWVVGIAREGRVIDAAIGKRPAVRHENALGWAFHYVIGIAYAVIYLAILALPRLPNSALAGAIYGILTLAAPLLFMKPAMGGGICGRNAPDPWASFAKTLSAHLSFGLCLWIATAVLG
ncbi:DUF2938 family protein [Thioclava kandeliae]